LNGGFRARLHRSHIVAAGVSQPDEERAMPRDALRRRTTVYKRKTYILGVV